MRHSVGLIIMAVLALGACGGQEEAGEVTAEESRQLNEAAEMLDASADSLVAANETELGNGETAVETGDSVVAEGPETKEQ
jgi:hypothetical protein